MYTRSSLPAATADAVHVILDRFGLLDWELVIHHAVHPLRTQT